MNHDPTSASNPSQTDTGSSDATDQILTEDGNLEAALNEASQDQTSSTKSLDPLVQCQIDLVEANKRTLLAQAELENFRKRLQRDMEQTLKFATMNLLRDLLEVSDNLQRALAAAEGNSAASGLADGVRMVEQQLEMVLAKHHCSKIPAVGEAFDPNYHQAIVQNPSPDYPAGTVMMEAVTGYQLYDRVIRPSQVIVSSGSPESQST